MQLHLCHQLEFQSNCLLEKQGEILASSSNQLVFYYSINFNQNLYLLYNHLKWLNNKRSLNESREFENTIKGGYITSML